MNVKNTWKHYKIVVLCLGLMIIFLISPKLSVVKLNTVGLCFNLLGAILMFFCGIPKYTSKTGAISLICEQVDEVAKKKAIILAECSYFGVIFLIWGFSLQLTAGINK